jgi:hypothetical protein
MIQVAAQLGHPLDQEGHGRTRASSRHVDVNLAMRPSFGHAAEHVGRGDGDRGRFRERGLEGLGDAAPRERAHGRS